MIRLMLGFIVAAVFAATFPFLLGWAKNGDWGADLWLWPVAFSISSGVTCFIAAPIFFVFRRFGWVKWWQVCLSGSLVGFLMALLSGFFNVAYGWNWLGFTIFSVPVSILSAFVFWLFGVRGNPSADE